MNKVFQKILLFGNKISGIKGWVYFLTGGGGMAWLATFISSLYEQLGLTQCLVLAFASFCLVFATLFYASELWELYIASTKPKPLTDILKRAEKFGWNLYANNMEILDFLKALRQSGLDGEIQFKGRPNSSSSDLLIQRQPLYAIPKEHWEEFEIEHSSCFIFNRGVRTLTEENSIHCLGVYDWQ